MSVCLSVCLSVGTGFAEGPAVSAINGKIEALGGNIDGESSRVAAGSLTLPLSERFGVQFDGAFGEIDNDDLKGGAIHLFTRDPQSYLVGLTGLYAELEDTALERYGIETEGYFGQFTIAAAGGYQGGDIDDSTYGSLDLRYYPMENLMVAVGGSIADSDDSKAHIGAEYQVIGGLALFTDLATGENGYDHVLGGIRYCFGAEKALIKRHREDDPFNSVLAGVIGGYGSLQADQASAAAERIDDGSVLMTIPTVMINRP